MRYPRRRLLAAGAALVAAPYAAWAEPKEAAGTATPAAGVAVGALFPMSGPGSLVGDECLRGVQLAVADINQAGGVAGKIVSLVQGDADARAQSATEASALISSMHVNFVLGTGSSDVSYPGTAAAELAQLPYIELNAPADGITGRGFKYLLRTGTTTSMTAQVVTSAMTARFAGKKIGLLFNTGATAGSIAGAALAIWGQSKTPVALSVGYPEDVADLHEPVSRLRRAGVEVLLHAAGPDDVLQLFQAAHDVGWKPQAIFGCGDGYGLRETAQAIGPAFDGTYVAAAPFYPLPARYIQTAYAARFGMAPRSADSLTSYVGAKLVLDILNKAGGDSGKLLAALRRTDIPTGTLTNGWGVVFDKTGQNTRSFSTLQQWRGQTLLNVT